MATSRNVGCFLRLSLKKKSLFKGTGGGGAGGKEAEGEERGTGETVLRPNYFIGDCGGANLTL